MSVPHVTARSSLTMLSSLTLLLEQSGDITGSLKHSTDRVLFLLYYSKNKTRSVERFDFAVISPSCSSHNCLNRHLSGIPNFENEITIM